MKFTVPAKTFLVGEYVALTKGPAIILTTTPCFELELVSDTSIQEIHPQSPAGKLWEQVALPYGVRWFDPYGGRGGMGASSAQFLGVYSAIRKLNNDISHAEDLLAAYFQYSALRQGMQPSGYDLLAQRASGCVFLSEQRVIQDTAWPFSEIAFILIHTNNKLATHEHLQVVQLPAHISCLEDIAHSAQQACRTANAAQLILAINQYHDELYSLNLMTEHSQHAVEQLRQEPGVVAAKGCGALGADVLLLLVKVNQLQKICNSLTKAEWTILATLSDLYKKPTLIENNCAKTLEISP